MEGQPDQLTPEQHAIVVKGIQAEYLLSQEAFAEAINDLSSEITNRLLSTGLSQQKEREELFQLHLALNALVQTLKNNVAAKAVVEHNALLAEEQDEMARKNTDQE